MEEEKISTPEVEEAAQSGSGTALVTKEDELHGENLSDRVKTLSPGRTVLKRFFRSKLSIVGLVILLALFLISFFGPLFSPWGETAPDRTAVEKGIPDVMAKEIVYVDEDGHEWTAYDVVFEWPKDGVLAKSNLSADHWLGTDKWGFDIFTRLMLGGRVSLTIGFVVIILETLIGVVLGGVAGYFGGKVDNVIMRIVDVLMCIPQLPIMLILSSMFQYRGIVDISKLYYMMGILTLLGWAGTARLVRGQILSLREQEFMLAAKCSGLSVKRKIFKHLLPNVLPQLIVTMTLGLGSVILMEATLGFLNIGAPLGTATWGTMISEAQDFNVLQNFPNFWIPPGICITLAILAFNFVGDGLRDAFDPKMKR
ncbi:MAG: ABC transporter permease [Clostridiales bacterium]|nr:ABC transporter permease [Clostridiales bacterium]